MLVSPYSFEFFCSDRYLEPQIRERNQADETFRPKKFDELTLFRYSALTLNGHRIHYDAHYAAAEGYGGLVVHGPLLAQRLVDWAVERLGGLQTFSFRASSPLLVHEQATLGSDGARFWVAGPDGRLCMMARAA